MSALAILEELKEMGVTGPRPAAGTQGDGDLDDLQGRIQQAVKAVHEATAALNEAVSGFANVLNEALEVDADGEGEGDDE